MKKTMEMMTAAAMAFSLAACSASSNQDTADNSTENIEETAAVQDNASDTEVTVSETLTSTNDSEHVIEVSGTEESYSNIKVTKTGDSDQGDEADFYGDNAAIFATDGAALDLNQIEVETDGTHANAVFSCGTGTTVNISDSVITTTGNCSGGLMTTGGGTMNASNLTVHTTGNSSAAIRSDRGGGTVTVNGGSYTTDGKGSPVIYSTADITVSDAVLTSTASQGVVVEGKNSVTLNNVILTADNNTKNSDKSSYYQAVMIYQSMSGDASAGKASFTMNGGTLTNKNGDIFFVNNTYADITLTDADIINESDGVFLRAAAAGWGSEGSNGGHVNLYASKQDINGDIVVDSVSSLNLYLTDSSTLIGSVNAEGEVYVELTEGSVWKLTGDSYVTSLTCDADSIDLNGYTLYVNGEVYTAGTSSKGEAVDMTVTSSGSSESHGGMPGGEKPDGMGEPPAKP